MNYFRICVWYFVLWMVRRGRFSPQRLLLHLLLSFVLVSCCQVRSSPGVWWSLLGRGPPVWVYIMDLGGLGEVQCPLFLILRPCIGLWIRSLRPWSCFLLVLLGVSSQFREVAERPLSSLFGSPYDLYRGGHTSLRFNVARLVPKVHLCSQEWRCGLRCSGNSGWCCCRSWTALSRSDGRSWSCSWFWWAVWGYQAKGQDTGGWDGGQGMECCQWNFTAATVETSATHTLVRLTTGRIATAKRKACGYSRREGEETRKGKSKRWVEETRKGDEKSFSFSFL